MNPLCYRTWNEIIQKHGFQQLVLYRVVDYKGGSKTVPARAAVFLKVIDLQKGGRVVWAGLAQGEDAAWVADPSSDAAKVAQERADRVPAEERAVVASTGLFGKLLGDLPAGTLKESDQILLLNTDDVAVDKNYLTVSGKDLAAEDGVVTALVAKGFGVVEKLASIYINPAEEYAGKAFYINPLFLKNLDALLEYSGSKINKIVAYKKIEVEAVAAVQPAGFAGTTVKTKGSEVAGLYVRVIDVGNGNIVFSGIVQNN